MLGSMASRTRGTAFRPRALRRMGVIFPHSLSPAAYITPCVLWVACTPNRLAPPAKIRRMASCPSGVSGSWIP